MKQLNLTILALFFLLSACLDSSSSSYDDTEDLAFLEEYAQEEGVDSTSSGLLYRLIAEGDEEAGSPASNQYAIIKYQFESVDNIYSQDTEDSFELVVPDNMTTFSGVGEGVQLMNEGARYEFVLPTNLATNDGRVYIFEVQLESYLREDQEQFLVDNAALEDVEVTDSGLQYRVIEESNDGDTPVPTDRVEVKYKGTFTSGYIFDQTPEEETTELDVSKVISGFSEGLQLMNEGAKYEFFIPPSLGYGNNHPQYGTVLIFEVELVEIL